ncbi:hypothetical protein CAMSH0001_0530 [Campylobacter showae RM3277]|uniref:Uncharacterized protein n=1 Tax=Campylobacter showae RM3277 TaxID=553219 RepID=C6RFM4_9BACT|nr:hypothetical protein CAMSH0001_0530 [Campylobacter showae RM3277]
MVWLNLPSAPSAQIYSNLPPLSKFFKILDIIALLLRKIFAF